YEAMVLMSAAFERQDSLSFARAELAKAFDVSNKDARVANQYARFLLRQSDIPRAEEVLVDSLSVNARDVENLRLLASVRLAQQDWRGAEEVGVMLENAGDESSLASNIKSAAYIGLEDYNSVIETLSARGADAPLDAQPLGALVSAYIREERLAEAEDMLTRMLEADPDNYNAQLQVARVYAAQSDAGKFEDALIRATETDADRPEAYELLYRTYLVDNRREQAAALIERGLRASPDNEALKVYKADVLLSQGDRAGALAIYSELIETRPNDRIIANNFVSLSSDLRLDEQSIVRALEIAKRIEDVDNAFYRDTVGWAYYRAGEYGKALEYLTQAVEQTGDNAEMLYHLGAAQMATGDEDAARQTLQNALAAGGEDFTFADEVQALLDRM
ncbi:MAG: tetratricopeptide repeat protein, partial [Pseudomonadota bacterium]